MSKSSTSAPDCPGCGGAGKVPKAHDDMSGSDTRTCWDCNGTGRAPSKRERLGPLVCGVGLCTRRAHQLEGFVAVCGREHARIIKTESKLWAAGAPESQWPNLAAAGCLPREKARVEAPTLPSTPVAKSRVTIGDVIREVRDALQNALGTEVWEGLPQPAKERLIMLVLTGPDSFWQGGVS